MGGLGKTTLARVIYEKFSNDFEGSSFIANVREVSEKQSLLPLQKQLLAQTLGERNIDIWDVYDGVDMIKKRLHWKRVLVVLDDVNQLDQLEKLVGEYGWFGEGSWIIITTRDDHLLLQHEVHKIYKPNTLNVHDALKLFCLKAFKNEQPGEGYVQLSEKVISYAKGLMLALATEAIQAIGLASFDVDPEEAQSFEEYSEAFSKMFNLRLLMIDDLHIPNGLNHVSNSLRHLIWNGYFSKCLPSSFQPKELVKLELHSSNIEYLWKGVKV
ncbi:disease resistance protein RML1B-like [Quercus lobata]|uniref:disease resistance protein RML1B-like n=1 Tax=Quercus lobata TaxID=97700 RepID=UPI0012455CF5|nr:disease resistance protein RML1B-like [Quercus lobata]